MEQYFKSIYFKDYPTPETSSKSFTLAFSEPEAKYYKKIQYLSNEEIRELIGTDSYKQLSLFAKKEERSLNQLIKIRLKSAVDKIDSLSSADVTFKNSKKIPFQRWYPYIEGYSPDFVKYIINNYCKSPNAILDPFAGTGTTIFAADDLNISTFYAEINPLLQFIIKTKIKVLNLNISTRNSLADNLSKIIGTVNIQFENCSPDLPLKDNYHRIFENSKYFDSETFENILMFSNFINKIRVRKGDLLADLLNIATLSSLLSCSYLKKAGDVRFKTEDELIKTPPRDLKKQIFSKLIEIEGDIRNIEIKLKSSHNFIISNAKNLDKVRNLNIDSIITSPPYLNGTNYFRNTKLELWFLKYLTTKNELRLFRDNTLTCGINDVNRKIINNYTSITDKSPLLANCLEELNEKTYDKRIPIMVKDYFSEMYHIFSSVRDHLSVTSNIAIDIGDSIFANVHIPTDDILIELFSSLGFKLNDRLLLRKRRSRNKSILSQVLLNYNFEQKKESLRNNQSFTFPWKSKWGNFKKDLPHQQKPFSKRNWGHSNHSICSYQGKLKPSIAHQLVNIFVPNHGTILDPFSGVGTIPFEASLSGKKSFGFDISKPAYYISLAKVGKINSKTCTVHLNKLEEFISINQATDLEIQESKKFGFNKKLSDYYHPSTLNEILISRRFFLKYPPENPSQALVFSSLLHILHGNRPYALSRRSHPIVPYAPSGEFEQKILMHKLKNKVDRVLSSEMPESFKSGDIFFQDATSVWPQNICELDAIITSPPFFDSTRFYLANWIRLWFSGWSKTDFDYGINSFIEEKQKKSFSIYESIFRQGRERLKTGGVFVLHLGKSHKCDMAFELQKISKKWFKTWDVFDETVSHCESHGIRDKGTVKSHQYLILY